MADPPRLVFTICGSAGTLCNNVSSSCSINVVVVVVVVVVGHVVTQRLRDGRRIRSQLIIQKSKCN